METSRIEVSRDEARELYRKYRAHVHYSQPIDREIIMAYQKLAQGKLIIKALDSIVKAGVNENGFPKLAICRADKTACRLAMRNDGGVTMTDDESWWRRSNASSNRWFDFPSGSFPPAPPRFNRNAAMAQAPHIPLHLRPKRGLQNYHILWEAEWERVVPRDPFLLRRIGRTDLWVVMAMWDLTEIERAVLAPRLASGIPD